jgi:hypothetical protein
MSTAEPVVVAHYPFRTSAEAARLRLEAEGIPAFLTDAEVVDMDWFLANALGWIKVLVPAVEAARAAAILRETEQHRLIRRWRGRRVLTQGEETHPWPNKTVSVPRNSTIWRGSFTD